MLVIKILIALLYTWFFICVIWFDCGLKDLICYIRKTSKKKQMEKETKQLYKIWQKFISDTPIEEIMKMPMPKKQIKALKKSYKYFNKKNKRRKNNERIY